MFDDEHTGAAFLYLDRASVRAAAEAVDVVAVVSAALVSHARGLSSLPAEGYLGWQTPRGFSARSIAMQGMIETAEGPAYGLKMINASLGNVEHGIPRSQGVTILFDTESARPTVMMEAAYISATRTAAVTIATAQATAGSAGYRSMGLIGCGTLAKAHIALAARYLHDLNEVVLFDTAPDRAKALADSIASRYGSRFSVRPVDDARACVASADLVVPVTTVTEGYIASDWIKPGTLIAHVSLDDLLPDVVGFAELVLVDDWKLVSHDHRRLFGRMIREGRLLPPGESTSESADTHGARPVDGTLGDLFAGSCPGRKSDSDVIVSNPFGMAVLDVAVAAAVHGAAIGQGLGVELAV